MLASKLDELSPNPILLAPMVGLTHFAVRAALATFLRPGEKALWPTEMLNSRRIPDQVANEFPETMFFDKENGLCPQLLANEEIFIKRSVPKLEEWGAAAIDINMGCPVKKALKHNYGVALMGDPKYAAEIVKMTVARASVPVSVKLRAGFKGDAGTGATGIETSAEESFEYLASFTEGLFEAGASWITIHPRTAEQQRRGNADWNLIKRLKNYFAAQGTPRLIIGNGDIQCFEDVQRMRDATDCDRVMVGRAMIVKPWLLWNEPDPDPFTQGDLYGQFLKRVCQNMKERYTVKDGLRRIRFLAVQGKPWIEYGEYLYGRTMAANSYEDLENSFEKFFNQKQKIVKRTALRN